MEKQYIIMLLGFFFLFFYSCVINKKESSSSQASDFKNPEEPKTETGAKKILEKDS